MESCAPDDIHELYLSIEAVFAEYTGSYPNQRRLLDRIESEAQAHGGLEGNSAGSAKRAARVA